MTVKRWEIILWNDKQTGFRREYLAEMTEIRARAEARKRWAVEGWYVYNVCEVKVVPVDK